MNEWLMILSMIIGGGLFAAGGTDIKNLGGQKWLRRFLLPILLGLICLFAGVVWWRSLCFSVLLCIVLHLGYGIKVPYWRKFLVFCGYGIPTFFFGFTAWQIFIGPVCLLVFILSNWKYTASAFLWKGCEFMYGVFIAITMISAIGG